MAKKVYLVEIVEFGEEDAIPWVSLNYENMAKQRVEELKQTNFYQDVRYRHIPLEEAEKILQNHTEKLGFYGLMEVSLS